MNYLYGKEKGMTIGGPGIGLFSKGLSIIGRARPCYLQGRVEKEYMSR